jgi:hypothetical protein
MCTHILTYATSVEDADSEDSGGRANDEHFSAVNDAVHKVVAVCKANAATEAAMATLQEYVRKFCFEFVCQIIVSVLLAESAVSCSAPSLPMAACRSGSGSAFSGEGGGGGSGEDGAGAFCVWLRWGSETRGWGSETRGWMYSRGDVAAR